MKRLLILTILIVLLILPLSSACLLHGTVLDKNDNIVPYAEIKIECKDYSQSLETDKFGSFVIELNKSPCIISAKHSNNVGYKEITSIVGKDYLHIDIKADKLILKSRIYIYLILIAIILSLSIFIYKFKKKLKSSKFNNIIRILNEREKLILNEILKQKGKTTQAKLYHITKIPKVSLSRHIKSLENKKIIQTEKFGKLKKIKLSKWVKK